MTKTTILAALVLAVLASEASAQQSQSQTFRDSSGRVVGRSATDSQGSTVYYGPEGRVTGRASTDSQGTTTFRDSSGRTVGSSTAKR